MGLAEKRVAAFSVDTSFAFVLILFTMIIGYLPIDVGAIVIIERFVAALMLIFAYLIPYFFIKGQTIGKKSQHLQIVKLDGSEASVLLYIGRDIFKVGLTMFTLGLYGIVCYFVAFARKDGRTIHDFIFRTKVIDLSIKSFTPNKTYDNYVTLKPSDIKESENTTDKEEENEED